MQNKGEVRVYISCLGCYAGGRLHGHWFTIDEYTTPDDLWEDVRDKFDIDDRGFAACGGEEFVVHDYKGFGGYRLGEVGVKEAARIGALFARHGPLVAEAALDHAFDSSEADAWIQEHYRGEWDSREDFAFDLAEEAGDLKHVPDYIKYNIDWDGVADGLFLDDFFAVDSPDGSVHVFWRR